MDEHDLSYTCIGLDSLHRFRAATTDFWLAYRNADMRENSYDVGKLKTLTLVVRFLGDKRHDGIGWVRGKRVCDH